MAVGWAKSEGKSCEKCHKIRSGLPKSKRDLFFPLDCENCYVNLSQPIADNEIIVDLYNLLPLNFSDWSGLRFITTSDIRFVFEIFDIPKKFWDDYYQRLTFLNNKLIEIQIDEEKKKTKKNNLKQKIGSSQQVTK